MVTPADPRVAVYIDFDNIVMSRYDQVHRRRPGNRRDNPWRDDDARRFEKKRDGNEVERKLWEGRVDIGAILDYASSFGSIVISRAYADWSVTANAGYRTDVVERAIDLTQLFTVTSGFKNGADIRLSVDIVEDLFRLPDVTHVVIVAGDSDYIALAQRARRLGRVVVGIGVAGSTSSALISACDVFTLYDDLLDGEQLTAAVVEAASQSAPASEDESGAETATGGRSGRASTTRSGSGSSASTDAAEPDEDRDAVSPPPKELSAHDRDAARELLVRALRLVEDKNSDEDWQFQGETKQQMLRLNPAFKEKPLGFKTFTDFLESQKRVIEVRKNTQADQRRIRLRAGS